MKARVKATGEIVEVKEEYGLNNAMVEVFYSNEEAPYEFYEKEELDFDVKEKSFPKDDDYWTRLEHQYAGMAMQGILANYGVDPLPDDAAHDAYNYAHALVEMIKVRK